MNDTTKTTIDEVRAQQMLRVSEILKAIAHPVRLSILELLGSNKALTVSEVQSYTGIEQSLLSHHLIKMKDKGVLKSYREGKHHFYQLTDTHITQIFNCMENCSLIV